MSDMGAGRMQSMTIMGEWLHDAVRGVRTLSRTAPITLASCADGWSVRVGVRLPQRAAPDRQCEVGCLIPIAHAPSDLQIALGGSAAFPPGPLDLTIDVDGMHLDDHLAMERSADDLAPGIDPTDAEEILGTVSRAAFCRTAARVSAAALRNDHRPILAGVSLQESCGHWQMVATDSYVLRMAPLGGTLAGGPLVTPRAWVERLAREAQRHASDDPLRITRVRGGIVGWVSDEWYVAGRVMDGEYPTAEALIPDVADAAWTCGARDLDRALAALGDAPDPMVMTADDAGLAFTADGVQARVAPSTGAGASTEPIGLNRAFLRRIVTDLDDADITISAHGPLRPLMISQDDLRVLQMPIRLPKEAA